MGHKYLIEDKKSDFCLYWKADDKKDFRLMRDFLIVTNPNIEHAFIARLLNVVDDIREMGVGQTMYVRPAKWECYSSKDIDEFEKICDLAFKDCENKLFGEDISDNYRPSPCGFCIKRTAKLFIYRPIYFN